MSARLAIGTAAALAGLAALGRRGSRATVSHPEYWFHVTGLGSLEGIQAHGLQPGQGSNYGGSYQGHSRGRVFLTSSKGIIFWSSRTEILANSVSNFEDEESFDLVPIVFRFNSGLPLDALMQVQVDDLGTRDAGEAAAAFVERPIPADWLEVWAGPADGWISVMDADIDELRALVEAQAEWEEDDSCAGGGFWDLDFDVLVPRA